MSKHNKYDHQLHYKLRNHTQCEINWHLLPEPETYYRKIFPNIVKSSEWISVHCPFHEDTTPSFSINIKHGGFICRGECRAKGNLIQFHMRLHNFNFIEACKSLGVLPYDK